MAKSKKERSLKRVFKRILLGIGAVAAFMIAFFIFAVVYKGDTKPILSVADQFKPGDSWKLTEERVEPPRIMCAGDIPCPSIVRWWIRDKLLSIEEFRSIMDSTGWQYSIKGNCEPSLQDRYLCYADAHTELSGSNASIYVSSRINRESGGGELFIDIRRS